MSNVKKRIAIIGGGIVGLATAYKILKNFNYDFDVVVYEKENKVGLHQSGSNSGVLHAGLYYKPGSLKAKLATNGINQMVAFCSENNIHYEICGKIVLARTNDEVETLKKLYSNGINNNVENLKYLDSLEEIKNFEPNAEGVAAVFVGSEGIVNFSEVCNKLYSHISNMGGEVRFNSKFKSRKIIGNKIKLFFHDGSEDEADYVINCAGLYSDVVAKKFGINTEVKIIPFRGDYYKLNIEKSHLVKNLIYPVPDIKYPFLGVHLTRKLDGSIEVGPNAVFAFAREGYNWKTINVKEFFDAVFFIGFTKFLLKHYKLVFEEMLSSIFKYFFIKKIEKLFDNINSDDIVLSTSGVRAQAISKNGELIQDFYFLEVENSLHVLNAPSPGATASLAIADYIIDEFYKRLIK